MRLRLVIRAALWLLIALGVAACVSVVANSGGPGLSERREGSIRIASYNVHYIIRQQEDGRWGMSGWEERKGPLDATFKALDADLIAFQEMETFSRGSDGSENLARDWLLSRNPGYGVAATGAWRTFPTTQPILYRTDRLTETDKGWFFFSETPDVIYSRTFNGSWPAFASWAAFEDREGNAFRVINVHFDYSSRENRRRSADLVAERTAPWIAAGETVILLGDLNEWNGSRIHRRLEEAGLRFLPIDGATFHLDRGVNLFGAIDHIALSGDARAIGEPVVFREKLGDVWPTDHYPVVADIVLE